MSGKQEYDEDFDESDCSDEFEDNEQINNVRVGVA